MSLFGQVDGLAGLGRPARWGGLSEMFGGFDRRFPAPPESYENYFKAYHMSRFGGRERKDVSYGGKVIMPPSALATITDLELESPWTFVLRGVGHARTQRTHAGVVEFIADEGRVYLPSWMMRTLELQDGDPIHIQGTRLPKGKFVKLQPQTVDFLEISDPKAVLEQALRNYPTLTRGDIIEISYNCLTFEILIMEVQPDAEGISIIETDLEVDFAPPKGYVEPAPQPRAAPSTMASKLHIDQAKYDVVRPHGSAQPNPSDASSAPFRGLGQTLSGKKTKGKKDKPITPRDPQSLVRSTDRPAIVTNDTLREDKHVPAALHLPFGQLFFGYDVERLPVPVSQDSAPQEAPAQDTAFQGQGHTLWSRPSPEVIDIDSD
ncbi:ubiquitin fusion degradation protein [Malassezia caprae]|uniref:Ubiquitin fusion degradation protein n=1 Tax=Malassezia caprae TaxID=1381934 RepID=A0AAF0EA87_9BASI|nr:ubiquitin fusion degradation protein [Malassezia caprae]